MRLRRCNPEFFHPMASPVAHSIAGFWTFMFLATRLKVRLATACRRYLPQLVLLILLANLPDVDFLFGVGTGANANALHHGFTHSVAAALFVALAVSCVWRIAGTFWRSVTLCFLAYSSHLLIDMCTGTKLGWNSTASDIPLFWPWVKEFRSPLVLLVGVRHKDLPDLFSMENLQSSFYELLIFGAITGVLVALWVRHQGSRTLSYNRETALRAVGNSNPIR
jgi:inner membrane protein